jgi:phage shock protein PspC (stress-responsive transcriptional regulator)
MFCTQCGNEITPVAVFCSQCGKQHRFDGGVRTKRLERDMTKRQIAGVCAGLGNYLNLDVTLIRIAMLTAAIVGGFGVIAYIIAWIAMPKNTAGHAPYALPPAV